jgi:FtsP/CotA-like multicopper oxidase with cupredoxin domain
MFATYRLPGDSGCSYPGPLVRLEAGKQYLFNLENTASSAITNVHTHGLHIVGDGDSDDITRGVSSGNCLQYTRDLDARHPGGTYWYHAYHHKDSLAQVTGGAFGMLVVEDHASDFSGNPPAWASNELNLLVSKIGNTYSSNGLARETFTIEQNKWHRLRMAHVHPSGTGTSFDFQGQGDCEIRKVANDGIWTSAPGPASNSFFLSGSSRADFAIRCSTPGDVIDIMQRNKEIAKILSNSSSAVTEDLTYTIVRPPALSGFELPVPATNFRSISKLPLD